MCRSGGESIAPFVAGQLRDLSRDRRRRAQVLLTAAERFAVIRDVAAMLCVGLHTMMKRGSRATEPMQPSLAKGSWFLLPRALEGVLNQELASMSGQMTANLQAHWQAANMEDKRYTMHSLRVGGAASHSMDGTAMDVLMEQGGCKFAPSFARRYVGVTASAGCSGGHAFSRNDVYRSGRPGVTRSACKVTHSTPKGQPKPDLLEAKVEVWV